MRINHVALYVNDLEAARTFFEKYFQAASSDIYINHVSGFRSYFLSFGNGCRLELMTRPGMADSPKELYRTGYAHLSVSVGSEESVDALSKRLSRDGYTVLDSPRVTGDGYYECSIRAFEDNVIEITV